MLLSELRQTPHLSASSIGDFIECGLLYKFGRIDRIPMEFVADALEFGSTIHRVLESYYQAKMIGDRMSLKDIHGSFENLWRCQTFKAKYRISISRPLLLKTLRT
ncbi:MAG: PD-(D/E)XK nuclease family protein [Desulfobacterales bacterium]